jgi:hypothetical protein
VSAYSTFENLKELAEVPDADADAAEEEEEDSPPLS